MKCKKFLQTHKSVKTFTDKLKNLVIHYVTLCVQRHLCINMLDIHESKV